MRNIFVKTYLNLIKEYNEAGEYSDVDVYDEVGNYKDSNFSEIVPSVIPPPDIENFRNPVVEKEALDKKNEAQPLLGSDWAWRIFHQVMHPHDDRFVFIDLDKDLTEYKTLPLPTNKDEQRIYDIVKKASYSDAAERYGYFTGGIKNMNIDKAKALASTMNKLIMDDTKRMARRLAAERYGLTFIAREFK